MRRFGLVILAVAPFVIQQFVAAQTPAYTQNEEAADARFIRFAQREISIKMELENAQLRLANDVLETKIATAEGRLPNTAQSATDKFVLAQAQLAAEATNKLKFAFFGGANPSLRGQIGPFEPELERAIQRCFGSPPDHTRLGTLTGLRSACASLQAVHSKLAPFPPETQKIPSMFDLDKPDESSEAQKLLREDSARQARDRLREDVVDDIKRTLLLDDHQLVGLDQQLRLMELSNASIVKHNAAHPDSPQADVVDLISHLKEFRTKIAGLDADYRDQLSSVD